jgi:L-lactate dehydrogenase complex protein LldG
MSSREKILKATLENQPSLVVLPVIDFDTLITYEDIVAQFESMLIKIGGTLSKFKDEKGMLAKIHAHAADELVINMLDADELYKKPIGLLKSAALEKVHTAYIRGSLGVAENAAIWIDERAMGNRVLPFICQHLVIVIKPEQIVATMHHAYKQINVTETGFGTFIAGPSKTADIEQSLVIGAHGPRSLQVFLAYFD